jgi:hypothetical protein
VIWIPRQVTASTPGEAVERVCRGKPASATSNWRKCTERRADVKFTYKLTDLEDDQCYCKSTREMMRKSSDLDLCQTSAIISTEAVPNGTENNDRTYQIVSRTAMQDTVTNWGGETVETTNPR